MNRRFENGRAASWFRAHPIVGWIVGLSLIFGLLGLIVLGEWAKVVNGTSPRTAAGAAVKGFLLVSGALFVALRARRQMRL